MSRPAEDTVLCRTEGRVAILTLNRPEARNALSMPLLGELHRQLDRLEADPAVGAVCLTGEGPAFCAGADMKESARGMEEGDFESRYARATQSMRLYQRLPRLSKPVVAAVNGFAVAGGCGLALSCDVVMAADNARFGFPEVGRGLIPAMVMVSLSRVMGKQHAMDLLLTGRLVGGDEAVKLGMAVRVVPRDLLMTESVAYAQEIAAKPPMAVRLTKDLFRQVQEMEYGQAMEHARDVNQMIRQTRAAKQGAAAFAEGRAERL